MLIEALIYLLVKICLAAVCVYAVIWVAESVSEKPFPPKIKQLLWLIFMLIVLLLLVQLVTSMGGLHTLTRGL